MKPKRGRKLKGLDALGLAAILLLTIGIPQKSASYGSLADVSQSTIQVSVNPKVAKSGFSREKK